MANTNNSELFYLKWNNFQKNVRRMRDEEDLVDITFACEGKKIGAHKLVLYSCSPYFKDLLKDNKSVHPIFFFHDISYDILKAILEYMYLGEVHITNENLKDFIRVAEALQIRGLSKDTNSTDENVYAESSLETYVSQNKRLKLLTESTEDEDIDDPALRLHQATKREPCVVQPKVESLEFIEELQQQSQNIGKQPQSSQSVTYSMNIENFVDKANTSTNIANQPSQQTASSQFIPSTSQQSQQQQQQSQQQQQQQSSSIEYKSEDEMWVEKAIDIGTHPSNMETSPKNQKGSSSKSSSAHKANCLTPRSCPVCSRVYSNVSNLRQHMRLIHNPQAVVCPICQKHFNSDLYLKRHYSSIHSINPTGTEGDDKSTIAPMSSGNNWNYSETGLLHQ